MSNGGNSDAGLIAAIVAGGVAVLGAIGGAIKWLARWRERHQDRRAAKLQAWHDELAAREVRLDAERAAYTRGVEDKLAGLQQNYEDMFRQNTALHAGYKLLAAALRALDPTSTALRMADELLRVAFPPDPLIPPAMVALLSNIDEGDGQ